MEGNLTQVTIDTVIDLLSKKAGWEKKSINGRFLERVILESMKNCGLEEEKEWLSHLQKDARLLHDLIGALAVTESWFFRDAHSFEYLIYYIRKYWQRAKALGALRILSVGCSRGEEPYSVALALLDAGLEAHHFVIEAIDVSREAIAFAERGVYRQRSFRGEERPFRFRHFTQTDDGWAIADAAKERVRFNVGNIVQPPKEVMRFKYDIIFCRNLLIYLHGEAQKKVVEALNDRLKSQGVLIVSPSETALMQRLGYQPEKYPRSCAFYKGKPGEQEKIEVIKVKEPPVEEPKETLLEEASRLADAGELESAERVSKEYLVENGGSAEAHFVLALIRHAMEDEKGAEELFRRAVYLDPNYYEALVYLALLAENDGEHEKAEKFRVRAERVLENVRGSDHE